MTTYNLTWTDIDTHLDKMIPKLDRLTIWGIPRGGSIVAGLARLHSGITAQNLSGFQVTQNPTEADVAVDDIISSGLTASQVKERWGLDTIALIDKRQGWDGWVVFPWEETAASSGVDVATRMLEYIGEDPNRDGLIDTPSRMVKAWEEIYSGYYEKPEDYLTWFEDDTDEMVVCRNIQFYSTCEHHMLPFFGNAAIGYIPTGKVLGISKLARVVNAFARRLQVQERLTRQVGEFLQGYAEHVAVQIEACHVCMMARGVNQQGSTLVTNYLTGAFREPETRQEFFATVRGNGK